MPSASKQQRMSEIVAASGGKAPAHILMKRCHPKNPHRNIPAHAIKKIGFKASVPTIREGAIDLIRKQQRELDTEVLKHAITICAHYRRKTIALSDVQHAIELVKGRKVYG